MRRQLECLIAENVYRCSPKIDAIPLYVLVHLSWLPSVYHLVTRAARPAH